jgi:hypothetical protein
MIHLNKDEKLTFSGHETFPLKYGWVKKVFDIVTDSREEDARKVFSTDDAIANFGVGKNMVSSMRHWAHNIGILSIDTNKSLILSVFANIFFSNDGLDPWLENDSTLWLLHWKLAKNKNLFSYYWLFNYSNKVEFSKEQVADSIISILTENSHTIPAKNTLKRDVECLVRNYTHKPASKDGSFTEDNIESPLAELSLVKRLANDKFQINRGSRPNLINEVFIFILLQFWKEHHSKANTLSLEAVTYDPESPGRICLLDEDAIISYAFEIETMNLIDIQWSETAGIRQFSISKPLKELEATSEKLLHDSYT